MTLAASLGLAIYRTAGTVGEPFIRRKLVERAGQGKEDLSRLDERLGRTTLPRPQGPLVWLHAASVGEALSALPLIDAIRAEAADVSFLMTTGTVTSARVMQDRLPSGVVHQFAPVDMPAAAARFLDHWRPDLALWIESDFWPNLLLGLDRRRIPRVLVNGRISPASYARWQAFRPIVARLLSGYSVCLAQSERDAKFLRNLGAAQVVSAGNLKAAAPPLPVDAAALDRLRRIVGARPRWVAASTHPGEEEIAARVHASLARRFPGLLTVVVPRHADRGPDIERRLSAAGLNVARRAAGAAIAPDTAVYLADTMGELGLWYRLCPVAFVGKSLLGEGGQNPLEPARLDCALFFGPGMSNFADIAEGLEDCGAAVLVSDEKDLTAALARLLGDKEAVQRAGRASAAYVARAATSLARTMEVVMPLLRGAGRSSSRGRRLDNDSAASP